LQHFIDRKIAAGFEPIIALKNDEALTGAAKGFAFRMAEEFGIIPRGEVSDEVKALDQDARGALRKHGVRFGQFTIFMPLLLKPAPTRLRLVLWSLSKGLGEFPESPPPGLVTVPAAQDAVAGYYAMAGYRAAGDRAIRIDMLERLADMLRDKDSRGGFEANPDMLSITGMTLEQFADLMTGLGYKAEKGEREKVKAVAAEAPAADAAPAAEVAPAESAAEEKPDTGPEMEVFYTFTWGGRAARPARPQGDARPRGKGKPKGKGKPQGGGNNKPQTFQAKPKREKQIDPDNPFAAALAGFKKD
jgi:ATP-dependent RNA helicase SUPV3L1/SUV3